MGGVSSSSGSAVKVGFRNKALLDIQVNGRVESLVLT